MLKLSSLLKVAAQATAEEMVRSKLSESKISEIPNYLLTRSDVCPSGYIKLGTIKVDGMIFYLFQMF